MPLEVIEEAAAELADWQGSGMSVMEVSHRGRPFVACAAETESRFRSVMEVPDDYAVLFLQGGATGQFAAVPMNLTAPGDTIDLLHTGQWSAKAISEAKKYGLDVQVVADEKHSNYTTTPAAGSYELHPEAKYVHYTPNETIGGVAFGYVPETGDVPLVADMSSMILSQPTDVSKYGLIYAGTQKNLGPAGMCVVVVRRDLIGHARTETPTILEYAGMAANDSMLNTPPTFGIYLLGKILAWIEGKGGVEGIAEINRAKAAALYDFIDVHPFYTNPVANDSRSIMNVTFLLANPDLDKQFVAEATSAGLTNLAGHRSVGGMRASIYNAMPREGVDALISFMADFAATNG
jgi:phosphoserine aminotransferase